MGIQSSINSVLGTGAAFKKASDIAAKDQFKADTTTNTANQIKTLSQRIDEANARLEEVRASMQKQRGQTRAKGSFIRKGGK